MEMRSTRRATALARLLGAACLLGSACSDDEEGGTGGGSCTNADGCFEVTDPAGYDVRTECGFTAGSWSSGACDPTGYATRCTQVTRVSVDDGPERDVTYVYYWPADTDLTCLGTEETL